MDGQRGEVDEALRNSKHRSSVFGRSLARTEALKL